MRAAAIVALLVVCLTGCAGLPSLEGRTESSALGDVARTTLGRAVEPSIVANAGKTGIHPLPLGSDAFAARMVLAAAAEKTLDIQYYIWHADQTGELLLGELWRAAERGVRVRLLLDDANTAGLDDTIAVLDAHPNIEVRLYNPLVYRSARALNFIVDFDRVNRRMHNKSFTADNRVAIVGGRNVGNEYFGAGSGVAFKDLDVIVLGASVRDVSSEFDLYWNSALAYPPAGLVPSPGPEGVTRFEAAMAAVRLDAEAVDYVRSVRETPLLRELLSGQLAVEWTQARVVHDDPAKTLNTSDRTDILLWTHLMELMGRPQASLDLVSPYFVPGEAGTDALARLAREGVKVRVLTNSLSSTDVAVVHAGYAKRRCDLLRAGVQLYELKPVSAVEGSRETSMPGSGATGLHAKTFAVDRKRIFVGSFNFDPRSARINTEMGVAIDSPQLATRLANAFDVDIPKIAYEARLAANGACPEWVERTPAGEITYTVEPGTAASRRALIELLSLMPIDWLL